MSPFKTLLNTYWTSMAVKGVTPIKISYAITPRDQISLEGWSLSYDFIT